MWSRPRLLLILSKLRQHEIGVPQFRPGDVVARGFADLGFEEFLVIPGPRLLSLFHGSASELEPEHERFFFSVPSLEESLSWLHRATGCAPKVWLEGGRWWRVEQPGAGMQNPDAQKAYEPQGGHVAHARGEFLQEVVLECLLQLVSGENMSAGPRSLRIAFRGAIPEG